ERGDGRVRGGYCYAALSGGQKNWPLVLPWAPGQAPHSDTEVSVRPGPAREGPVAGPSLVSPVCSGDKLEDVEGLPGGRRRTAHPALTGPGGGPARKYPCPPSPARRGAGDQEPQPPVPAADQPQAP